MGAGLTAARVLRTGASTKATAYMQFGLMGPGVYLDPELAIKLNDNSWCLFNYQLASNTFGIKLGGNTTERNYDFVTTHTFSVGYRRMFNILHNSIKLGVLGSGGITYGYNTGGGYGSSGNSNGGQQAVYVQLTPKYKGDDVLPPFWTPTLSAGGTIGANQDIGPVWLNRFDLSFQVTAGLRDMYADYAKVQYKIATPQSYEEGIAQYRGTPLILSFGLKYRLFRVERNS